MPKKQFKSESKRLLELMINSIYTHREIFLRELISNASDAIDKLCYIALTDDKVGLTRDDFRIEITADAEARTLTVSDNGVGMTAEELEANLGVIAKSGSLQFKKDIARDGAETPGDAEPIDIIGQFGVGFYAAFMVASEVRVVSRAYGSETASVWLSEGADGYTVAPCEKDAPGTDVILTLKPDADGEEYGEFLEEYTLHNLVKKYSDYIRWPIVMDVTRSRRVENAEASGDEKAQAWEDYTEREVLNSRVPLWQRPKAEVTDAECFDFYKQQFGDASDPVSVVRVDAEGAVSYRAMLFIPGEAPYDYYTREYEPGLKLYASGVMIQEKCAALLPEYFRFVRGVVDSQDLSLNISRETLQHDRQLRVIAANLERKIKSELLRLMEREAEKYEAFFQAFGLQLKYGVVSDYGADKDNLKDLLLFYSPRAEKLISLGEYVRNMPEDQPYIYYACGERLDALDALPQTELVRERGFDILYLTEDVDEFVVTAIGKYKAAQAESETEPRELELRSVKAEDLGLQTEDEKRAAADSEASSRELLDFVQASLDGKIAAARLARNLKSAPVCLSTQGGVTLEMERYFAASKTPLTGEIRAERVLELNAAHAVFAALQNAYANDRERAAKYAQVLYDQACLLAGLPVDDAARLCNLVTELMV
ncbi:MAG: molecular chaperone HtpG [Oscillospiraceae bacterium]|jgi:molecular chaperone HtpG|nr:molecular chaperone HtpG [Oscillospiraceae bacterium]